MFLKLKKLSIVLLVVVFCLTLLSISAFAGMTDEAVLGNNRWAIDSSGRLKPDTNTGGMLVLYEKQTTGDTVLTTESGKTFILDTIGTSEVPIDRATYTLPNAAVGLEYTFIVGNAEEITIRPESGDTIKYLTLDASDAIRSPGNTADSVTVICGVADTWYIKEMKGTWTDYGQ